MIEVLVLPRLWLVARPVGPAFWMCLAMLGFGGLARPAVAAAGSPPTLTGEELSAKGGPGHAECLKGESFSFMVSGTATGPFRGTFTETVTGTVGGPPLHKVTAFSASFRIMPAKPAPGEALNIRGTEQLGTGRNVYCEDTAGDIVGGNGATYSARIFTARGSYYDHGTSTVRVFTGPSGSGLGDRFTSTLTQPPSTPGTYQSVAKLEIQDIKRSAAYKALPRRERRFIVEIVPSLSTSGETLTIEESMTLRARTENAGHVGDEHEWGPGSG